MPATDPRFEKLKSYFLEHHRMPSYAELGNILGFKSKNATHYLVKKWRDAGLIQTDETGRMIPGNLFAGIKVLGTVEAGFPTPAEEENADTLTLDDWLITNKEASYLLRVSGESMTEAGIFPGDTVILERGRPPKNGDIVVANVDGDWTMKFYEKQGRQITLRPANSKFKPIIPTGNMEISGVVTAVLRKLKHG